MSDFLFEVSQTVEDATNYAKLSLKIIESAIRGLILRPNEIDTICIKMHKSEIAVYVKPNVENTKFFESTEAQLCQLLSGQTIENLSKIREVLNATVNKLWYLCMLGDIPLIENDCFEYYIVIGP